MSVFDREVLAERAMAVQRHLRRVAERLPDSAAGMQPATDASDASSSISGRRHRL